MIQIGDIVKINWDTILKDMLLHQVQYEEDGVYWCKPIDSQGVHKGGSDWVVEEKDITKMFSFDDTNSQEEIIKAALVHYELTGIMEDIKFYELINKSTPPPIHIPTPTPAIPPSFTPVPLMDLGLKPLKQI